MPEIIEMGTVSARGQIAIPADIRKEMNVKEGQKMLFFLEDDTLIVKKVTMQSFEQLTKPLRAAKKKIEEAEVTSLIHKMRK